MHFILNFEIGQHLFLVDRRFILVIAYADMGDFLTVPQFARKIGVTDAAVYTAIKDNRVQYTKILGRLGIPKTELRRFKKRKNGIETKVFRKS